MDWIRGVTEQSLKFRQNEIMVLRLKQSINNKIIHPRTFADEFLRVRLGHFGKFGGPWL